MWILTREINEYYQEGEYFVYAFQNKPTFKELKDILSKEDDVAIEWIMKGGGRLEFEHEWYHLFDMDLTNKRNKV